MRAKTIDDDRVYRAWKQGVDETVTDGVLRDIEQPVRLAVPCNRSTVSAAEVAGVIGVSVVIVLSVVISLKLLAWAVAWWVG